jgi:parvulin-like peptidyl-prolyl isomerase
MWLACVLALLDGSLFVAPMYLDEAPPEGRAARAILVAHRDVAGAPSSVRLSKDAARELALAISRDLRAGADFEAQLRPREAGDTSVSGGVLGTHWPGMLSPDADRFLFSAELFSISEPLDTPLGFQVVQRVESEAGCRMILIAGHDAQAQAKAKELLAKLRAGADFAELAREHSADARSAARGGQYAIFERGPSDSLLKAAVFRAPVGALLGPLDSPEGLHLLQRVAVTEIAPELRDDNAARVRAILVAFSGARSADPRLERTQVQAGELAHELVAKIRAGADMAALAAEHDDDRGGRERRGDLGWIRRRSQQAVSSFDRVWLVPRGEVCDPIPTNAGWLIVRRER